MSLKCPGCSKPGLQRESLIESLSGQRCSSCRGLWIVAKDYWSWLNGRGNSPAGEPAPLALDAEDSCKSKLCPSCGTILMRFRVGQGNAFQIDQCSSCLGMWFDRNEWEILHFHGLHDDLHHICSSGWQRHVKEEEFRSRVDEYFTRRFGEKDYQYLKEIRAWLEKHPQRDVMLAFLADRDPFRRTAVFPG